MLMRRRQFIAWLGSAVAWPLAARAQQPAVPAIGYLSLGSPVHGDVTTAAFRKGLSEMGYVEGRNLAIEFRWARNDYKALPKLAADLVDRRVAVIVANGTAAPLAAKALTGTIPIVFSAAGDPVQSGIVTNLRRPGGNITGISIMVAELGAKRLELLHELLPRAQRFGVLINPRDPLAENQIGDLRAAAAAIGREIDVFYAGTNTEIVCQPRAKRSRRAPGQSPDLVYRTPHTNHRIGSASCSARDLYRAPIRRSRRLDELWTE
jgi:putative ABC transport system substrate-binding protein